MLEKTLESPLDCKEIQPVHPRGDQSWVFIGRTMLKLKLQYFGCLMWRADSWKRLWCWERLKAGGEGDDRGRDGWMTSPTQWTWVWVSSRSWWWTGRLGVLHPWGLKELDTTEQLNWAELSKIVCCCSLVAQSCLTLCHPLDCSLPGFSVHGISPGKNTGVGCHFVKFFLLLILSILQKALPVQLLKLGWIFEVTVFYNV